MTREKVINGCEFQNGCIEYKDISYLKVMPICAIYELSIACHDKENKCKYYQVYKQLEYLKKENEELKKKKDEYYLINLDYETKISHLIQALEEIKEMIEEKKKTIEMLKAKNWGIGTAKQEWEIEMLKYVLEDNKNVEND